MALGINLHGIVRGAINTLHPDVMVLLYRTTGQTVITGGQPKAIYAPHVTVYAQMQSEGAATLAHTDRIGSEENDRKFYLYSRPELTERIGGIIRPLSRGGDIFQIATGENWFAGTWWLVTATTEDFTRSGWVNVRATLQVNPPDFTYSDWYEAEIPPEPTYGSWLEKQING